MKKNYKKICLLLIVLIVSCFVLSGVEAAITINDSGGVGTEQSKLSDAISGLAKFGEYLLGMGASGLFATITAFINVLTIALYLVLNTLFGAVIGVDQRFTSVTNARQYSIQ